MENEMDTVQSSPEDLLPREDL
ncbi:hypothetical protein CCACVL1_15324 [Corchorus capsularis]|uniref:Uncharacterized protein n=1 Tax=Corchorus capsularis TaxID=210143 RepID=A0A1R3I2P0_COCAP|nr:hypothetical protein CCACVL1_15324 [Corchorus capsularis]